MRLTLHSDFALRTLIFLAVAEERGATIPEIAAAYAISENHLRKVVGRLIESGSWRRREGVAAGYGWPFRRRRFRLGRPCASSKAISRSPSAWAPPPKAA